MTTFGFSAFLKLVNLSAKRQRSTIKQRLSAEKKGGYDFHKATRKICHGYLVDHVSLDESITTVKAIIQAAERSSALAALTRLVEWRHEFDGAIFALPERVYESPSGIFKVRFTADFGVNVGGKNVAMHLWNTKLPALEPRLTRAALALIPDLYGDIAPDDFAVLSLRSSQLIRLGNPDASIELAMNVVEALDDLFIDIRSEGPRKGSEDRPTAR